MGSHHILQLAALLIVSSFYLLLNSQKALLLHLSRHNFSSLWTSIPWLESASTFSTSSSPVSTSSGIQCASLSDMSASVAASSCVRLTETLLQRIASTDHKLAAIISINPTALEEAVRLDKVEEENRGRLHCIPVLVQDNMDVAGLPTTQGLHAFLDQVPRISASAVAALVEAGALILGKSNMSPLSDKQAWVNSQTGGLLLNAFSPDTNRTTYGASGGAATGVACCFSALSLAVDDGLSVLAPASAAGVVAFRPPTYAKLPIAQDGFLPQNLLTDVISPVAQRVEDVALVFDLLKLPGLADVSTSSVLRPNGLWNARVGVLSKLLTSDFTLSQSDHAYARDPAVVSVVTQAMANMRRLGATVIDKSWDGADGAESALLRMERADVSKCQFGWRNGYLDNEKRFPVDDKSLFHNATEVLQASRPNRAPLPPYYYASWQAMVGSAGPDSAECQSQLQTYRQIQENFRSVFLDPLLEEVDVLVFPALPTLPPRLGQDAFDSDWGSATSVPWNLVRVAAWSGYAALTLPLGNTEQAGLDGVVGLPVGLYMLAVPSKLSALFSVAYGYQQNYPDSLVSPPLSRWTSIPTTSSGRGGSSAKVRVRNDLLIALLVLGGLGITVCCPLIFLRACRRNPNAYEEMSMADYMSQSQQSRYSSMATAPVPLQERI